MPIGNAFYFIVLSLFATGNVSSTKQKETIIRCERRRLRRRRLKESDSLAVLFCECCWGEGTLSLSGTTQLQTFAEKRTKEKDSNVIRAKCYVCVCGSDLQLSLGI